MNKPIFEKRWEARHPVYRPEAVIRAYVHFSKIAANECKNMLMSARNSVVTTYFDSKEMEKASVIGRNFIMKDLTKRTYIKQGVKAGLSLVKIAEKLRGYDLEKTDNKKLYSLYSEYFRGLTLLFSYYNLSRPDYVASVAVLINKELEKISDLKQAEQVKNVLLTPEDNSDLKKLDTEILNLSEKIKKMDRSSIDIKNNLYLNKAIDNLITRFSWISTQENNPPLDREYFYKRLKEMVKSTTPSGNNIRAKKTYFIKKYKLHKRLVLLTEYMASLAQLRLELRLNWTKAGFYILPLFKELNIRLGFVNKKNGNFYYSEYLLEEEIKAALGKRQLINSIVVKKRIKRYLLLMINRRIKFYAGKDCDRMEKVYVRDKNLGSKTEVTGLVANPGKIKGKAWVISPGTDQMKKAGLMKKGYILIAAMTRPQFMDAIAKASAIVTDEGGMTCHAAIVSREFNKPCIVGTKHATQIFKDGDLIEVDTKNSIVRKITVK